MISGVGFTVFVPPSSYQKDPPHPYEEIHHEGG